MVVNVGQIERGIATYIDKEIMPKLPENSVERVVLGFASARIIKRYSGKLIALKDTETDKLIGIFDKDGNVDIYLKLFGELGLNDSVLLNSDRT